MSCYYKALPRLIPQLLLLARPESEIILVSPWVEDVTLWPPLFGHGESRYTRSEIRLSELLLRLARDYDIRVTLIVRERDARLECAISPLTTVKPNHLTVREVPHLHAKAIVTDTFVLETSANILDTSLFRNVESCTIVANPYSSPRQWLRAKLGLVL
jgi:hypothetical protein